MDTSSRFKDWIMENENSSMDEQLEQAYLLMLESNLINKYYCPRKYIRMVHSDDRAVTLEAVMCLVNKNAYRYKKSRTDSEGKAKFLEAKGNAKSWWREKKKLISLGGIVSYGKPETSKLSYIINEISGKEFDEIPNAVKDAAMAIKNSKARMRLNNTKVEDQSKIFSHEKSEPLPDNWKGNDCR